MPPKVDNKAPNTNPNPNPADGIMPQKVDQDVLNGMLKPEEYDVFNLLFSTSGQITSTIPLMTGLEMHRPEELKAVTQYMDDGAMTQRIENGEELSLSQRQRKIGIGGTYSFIEIKEGPSSEKDNPKEAEVLTNGIKIYNHIFNEIIRDTKGPEKEFTRYMKTMSSLADKESGNYLRALDENPFLAQFVSDLTGGGPDIFLDNKSNSVNKIGVNVNGVNDWTLKSGTRNVLMDFYEAGSDILGTEYEKQQDLKTGWDARKEQKYLAKLDESYERAIKAHEELRRIPDEYQHDNTYLGNELSMHSGIGSAEARDCSPQIEGLRWQRAAIKNGWASRDLRVMDSLGMTEGMVNRFRTMKSESLKEYENKLLTAGNDAERESIQTTINEHKKEIEDINKWDNEVFQPFKATLINKKIEKPEDAMESITQIQSFLQSHKEDPIVKKYKFMSYMDHMNKVVYPTAYNNSLSELKQRKPYSGMKRLPTEFTKYDNQKELETTLDYLSNSTNIPKEQQKEVMGSLGGHYLAEKMLSGLSKEANPEFFDKNHPKYKVCRDKLEEYTTQYSKRLVEVLGPEDTKDFANKLERGDHSVFFSNLKDKIKADAKEKLFENFKKGKEDNPKLNSDPSLEEALYTVKNSKAKAFSGSTLYSKIETSLGNIKKAHDKFVTQLDEANKSRLEKKETIDSSGKKVITFVPSKEVKINQKEYEKYLETQMQTYANIEKYLAGKDQKIAELGGKPGDASVLGVNGEKRYHAMQNAKKALRNQLRVSKFFDNNGPTDKERMDLDAPGFEIDKSKFKDNQKGYEDFISAEKAVYEQNMKYAIIRENKLEKEKIDECLKNEEKIRETLGKEYLKEQDPAKKQELEGKIFASAEHTLYLNTVTDLIQAKENSVIKDGNMDVKNVAMADAEKLAAVSTDIKNAVKNTLKEGENGYEFKSDSKQYNAFKEGVINKSPLQNSFREMVLDGAKKGEISSADITKMQKRIVSDFQAKTQENAAKKQPKKEGEKKMEGEKKIEGAKKGGPHA